MVINRKKQRDEIATILVWKQSWQGVVKEHWANIGLIIHHLDHQGHGGNIGLKKILSVSFMCYQITLDFKTRNCNVYFFKQNKTLFYITLIYVNRPLQNPV